MAKKAWFALMNWKTRMESPRSPVRTRPLPLPRYRAPGTVAGSHAADGSAPRARRWSGRPVGGLHPDRPVAPSSRSPGQSVRTRATASPVFAQIGPDQPFVAGIPAHRVGDSSASMAPPSQVERCPPNRVNSKGSAGVDRMTVDQLGDYLKQHWPALRERLLNGTYEPKPVRRVEIPKPDGGGVRKLGIPTVLDRFIQQAVMQVLQRQWNPTFSQYSYGFRPRRSAHHAVAQAQQYIAQGHGWVIDLDLEKFFDRVNHDKLMGQIAKRVEDKRLLKLTRAFLNAGVMENGLVSPSVEGTPQGGPLSPLLSNLVLDELDRELEHRGHRFVRYADDCNIYVRSERAGQRVMESITRFITQKLKLKVNEAKSAVARPQERKFLGFSFTAGPE